MKKELLAICYFILMTFALFSQNVYDLDYKNGFKSYKFNSPKSNYSGYKFESVEDGGAERCILHPKESIGDIPIEQVSLYFVDGKLAKIVLSFNPSYSENLLEACKAAFGQPKFISGKEVNSLLYHQTPIEHRWESKTIELTHRRYRGNPSLVLSYELLNYESLQQSYLKKKYSSKDF